MYVIYKTKKMAINKYSKVGKLRFMFSKHLWASDTFRVPVSRHYFSSTFGVRQRHDASVAEAGEFLCLDMPGTGFFIHSSDSNSYQKFTRDLRNKVKPTFVNLLRKREPNYARAIDNVKKVLKGAEGYKARFLELYLNSLQVGQQAELLQRLEQGVKDKSGHHLNKDAVSLITRYKGQIATLQHDMEAAQMKPLEYLTEAQQEMWARVHKAFSSLMTSRRLFCVEQDPATGGQQYKQVFADLGIFDFVWMRGDTPILRDSKGYCYYFYPFGIIKAKDSLNFEMFRVDSFSLEYAPLDLSTLTQEGAGAIREKDLRRRRRRRRSQYDVAASLYGISHKGRMAQMIIPELGFNILCSKPEYLKEFVDAYGEIAKENILTEEIS